MLLHCSLILSVLVALGQSQKAECWKSNMGWFPDSAILAQPEFESDEICMNLCKERSDCKAAVSSPRHWAYRECFIVSAPTVTARNGWKAALKSCFGGDGDGDDGKVEYKITVKIGSGRYDGTYADQFVKIGGTSGLTEELQCEADFSKPDSTVTCTVYSSVNIGDYRCVVWRTVGTDGWEFTELGMSVDGVAQKTFNNKDEIDLDDSETKIFCLPGVEYEITVAIGSGRYDGTNADQFVKISGTNGTTKEIQCKGDFSKPSSTATCTINSHVQIGDYKCVIWRTVGTDGWVFTKLDMSIDGVAQSTFNNKDKIDLDDSETKTFCIDSEVDNQTGVEYKISVVIGSGRHDKTNADQFVKISGTNGTTEELQCKGDFSKPSSTATCTVNSHVQIGDYKCVIWRTVGTDGWIFTELGMSIDGVAQQTIENDNKIDLDDSRTETFCLPGVEYKISVVIGSGRHDKTNADQFVKISGTDGTTEELQCKGDFSKPSSTATCTVNSHVQIGEYKCVIWRTVGTDGWIFTELGMSIDGVAQQTIKNDNKIDLDDSRTETFCLPVEYKITVEVGPGRYDGTYADQFVAIGGTSELTEESQCEADFSKPNSTVTCTVYSSVNIGEYRCVVWRTVGTDGWEFTKLDMSIDGIAQKTFYNEDKIDLDDSETKIFCLPGIEYEITVRIGSGRHDKTNADQFVKISGTNGTTEEFQCKGDFSKPSSTATCTVNSHVQIGDYKCVIWRTVGTDGWIFTELDMRIDGIAQETFKNEDKITLDDSRTEKFCLPEN